MAEKSQTAPEDQEEDQDKVEAQIAGSENIWDSQLEMQHITNKLTRDKNYKSPAQLAKEKKLKEK